ncbi:MAG TPA: hypothetical protein VGF64_09610 [Acidimicrobiales bacterium]
MSPADDASFEIADLGTSWPHHGLFDPLALDEGTASRILDGLGPDDVPPGYVGLARLLAAASAPAHADELEEEATVIAAFLGEPIQTVELPIQTTQPPSRRRRGTLVRGLVSQKVAVAAVAGGLVVGGAAAAAATGSLPSAAQGVASQVLSFVGLDVPGPSNSAGHHPVTPGTSGTPPTTALTGPGSADSGSASCIAPCGGLLPPGAKSSAGAAASGAPAGTPNPATGTTSSASKGASSAGTTRADNASGGASTAGSGNAGSNPGPGATTGTSRGSSDTGSGAGGAGSGAGNAGSHQGGGGANSSSQGQAHGKP